MKLSNIYLAFFLVLFSKLSFGEVSFGITSEEFERIENKVTVSGKIVSDDIAHSITLFAKSEEKGFWVNKNPFRISSGESDYTFEFNFDVNNTPFSVKEVMVDISYIQNNTTENSSISFYVFFTPYNTIEIWNEEDFENLDRVWY